MAVGRLANHGPNRGTVAKPIRGPEAAEKAAKEITAERIRDIRAAV